MRLRTPPNDYLEQMGLVMPPDPDGLYVVRDGRARIEYPACLMGGQVWEGPAEADNATKRLAVGMYALEDDDLSKTRKLYAVRPGLLEQAGKLTVASIMLELHALARMPDLGSSKESAA